PHQHRGVSKHHGDPPLQSYLPTTSTQSHGHKNKHLQRDHTTAMRIIEVKVRNQNTGKYTHFHITIRRHQHGH
ncbi:hypothetical protein NDU88_005706, partial [Pleurodeles waltl]